MPEEPVDTRYWCLDQTRLGLFTQTGRKLTAPGVTPIGIQQWTFSYYWLYGAVEPLSGNLFLREYSHLDGVCFQRFLQELARSYPYQHHVLQLDNARAHTARWLQVPTNITLLFQPPYCPELNPIERLWQDLKASLRWQLFESLEELRQQVGVWLRRLSRAKVSSLVAWDWLVDALSVAGF